MSAKKKWSVLAVCFFALLHGANFIYDSLYTKPTLTVGFYLSENTDNIYEKIERAGKKLNLDVKYESGIMRRDYAEWLAARFLVGDEPDVFLLLPEDFTLYARKGALKDLSPKEAQNLPPPGENPPGIYNGHLYAVPMGQSLITISNRTENAAAATEFLTALLNEYDNR